MVQIELAETGLAEAVFGSIRQPEQRGSMIKAGTMIDTTRARIFLMRAFAWLKLGLLTRSWREPT